MLALNVSYSCVERIRKHRYDDEYKPKGVRNWIMLYKPLAGKRQVRITERQTMSDFAESTQWLVDVLYPDAVLIRVVLDNFVTH